MGVYEKGAYQTGTQIVGEAIARATAAGAISVVGGGDAAAAAHMLGFAGDDDATSQPAAARHSNFSKARRCPASPRLNP